MEAEEYLPRLRETHEEIERLRAGITMLCEHWCLERTAASYCRKLLAQPPPAPPPSLSDEIVW